MGQAEKYLNKFSNMALEAKTWSASEESVESMIQVELRCQLETPARDACVRHMLQLALLFCGLEARGRCGSCVCVCCAAGCACGCQAPPVAHAVTPQPKARHVKA